MTPAEFRAVREARYDKPVALAVVLGVDEKTVRDYEHGRRRVPVDIERTLLRLISKTHVPCPKCSRTILVEFWDGRCGACTQPLPEANDA